MKCSWKFKKPSAIARGSSCSQVAKFRVHGDYLCRKHAAEQVFDNVSNDESLANVCGIDQL